MFKTQNFCYIFFLAIITGSVWAQDANNTSNNTGNDTSNTQPQCSSKPDISSYNFGFHLAALFVILCTSSFGAFTPVISKKYPAFKIPSLIFFVTKHFGSGVILATAFGTLNNPCLQPVWTNYPSWPGAIAMMAALFIFFIEYSALKIADHFGAHANSNNEINDTATGTTNVVDESVEKPDVTFEHLHHTAETVLSSRAQILGITILECGICFHSVIIGMALSVAGDEFVPLFVALIFHQLFEGLGIGSRVAELKFRSNSFEPWLMSLAYGTTTPIGIMIGLLIRNSYNPNSDISLVVQGVFDSVSAGILLYAAMVELIANDFIYDPEFQKIPKTDKITAFGCLITGAGIMSVIAIWA
ncbi:16153_t:CDS:2 [Dentiscutata heterogama]|uniref:16153_t:CDS:1 n=1 Tax=Dentiscutata heterogama TaxID=1316150 RepID=A0ACA9KZI9_9GLOM|nr:16153_t:CDS:2 [Dentiscutata heterogama]